MAFFLPINLPFTINVPSGIEITGLSFAKLPKPACIFVSRPPLYKFSRLSIARLIDILDFNSSNASTISSTVFPSSFNCIP